MKKSIKIIILLVLSLGLITGIILRMHHNSSTYWISHCISDNYEKSEVLSITYYWVDEDNNKTNYTRELEKELYDEFFQRVENFHFKVYKPGIKLAPDRRNHIIIKCTDKEIFFCNGLYEVIQNGETIKHYIFSDIDYIDNFNFITEVFKQ